MPYINVIDYEQSEGALRAIYDNLIKQRGKLAAVHQIQSLNPPTIVHHMDLYMSIMFGRSPLSRQQREMMAVVVSKANDCAYCQLHHGEALNHYWKDEQRVAQLRADYTQLDLAPVDAQLCDLAWHLTRSPGAHTEEKFLQPLRNSGLEDRALLDATLVIAYFNFVNRIVLGLGLGVDPEEVAGYEY